MLARPSIFVGTPSVFEFFRLKQIYLYCETIITNVLHKKNRIAALIDIFFRNAWPVPWVLVFCCAKFHKNLKEEFRDN